MQVFQRKESSWGNIQGSESFDLLKNMIMSTQVTETKNSVLQLQNQDSSTTQSTGESGGDEVASFNIVNTNLSGYIENPVKAMKSYTKSTNTSPIDVDPTSAQTWSFQCTETSHFNGYLVPEYASMPMAMPHLEVMGMVSTRVPLPHNIQENEPIFVNAKQYHAILRRRKYRAKLEAQNKLIKNRKPYLHESRHLHALKRARGSGGRFLNKKQLQGSSNSLCSSQMANGQDFSESPSNGGNVNGSSSISPSSNSTRNNMFQHPIRFTAYPLTHHVSALMQGLEG